MKQSIITLTSDFGFQSQGIGNMEAVIAQIAPKARVIHLAHGLPDFDLRVGARTMEAVQNLPVGFHVCVVDPGVGSGRKAIIIKVKRGDFLIGPDNGVLVPAVRLLGGAVNVVEINNPKFMLLPVSPVFHGRHIFAPAAAYLAIGVQIEEFGRKLSSGTLHPAPYREAVLEGNQIQAEVININKFGSLHLNVSHKLFDVLNVNPGEEINLVYDGQEMKIPFVETFSNVNKEQPLILKDDFGRIEIAVNMGSFAQKYKAKLGDYCVIKKL